MADGNHVRLCVADVGNEPIGGHLVTCLPPSSASRWQTSEMSRSADTDLGSSKPRGAAAWQTSEMSRSADTETEARGGL